MQVVKRHCKPFEKQREAITLLNNIFKCSKLNIFSMSHLIFIFPANAGIPYPNEGLLNQRMYWRREDFYKTGSSKAIIVIAITKERYVGLS